MEKLIFLFLLVILPFVVHQDANALTISAIPVKQEFGANEWIKVNVTIQGYNGGQVNWIAHKPDNSAISGVLDQQIRSGKAIHQIIRSADDNEFGPWSINYEYGGSNQTVHVNVKPLDLTVITDKITYYEPDTMHINITSSYYSPYSKFAQSYFLDFYDQDGNKAIGITEIEVKADQPSVKYNLSMLQFAKYNPPGLYNLKIQYFNSVKYVPFLLGDINKLMEISINNSPTYYSGNDVGLGLTFSKLTASSGTIKITDPLGNTTSSQFYPQSVLYTLTLKNLSEIIGTYNFEIDYAGITKTGSFKIIQNPLKLPNIKLDIFPNKLNYRPGEIANFEIQISNSTTNSISTWVTSPNGNASPAITLPMNATEIIIPHKIAQNDSKGLWELYVNYDGIIKNSSFHIDGSPVDNGNDLDSVQYNIPTFVSAINSTTFESPTSIAIDHDNNIYIIDSGNSKIKKFDDKNKLLLSWGDMGSSNGQFKNPLGIFVNQNYVYVADSGNSRIIMFNKTGSFIYSWGTYGNNPGMFQIPTTINSDHSGDLFVGDMELGSIQLFDTKGTYEDKIDSSSADGANFSGIKALAFDSKDNLYAISTDNKILKYSRIGNFLNWYGSIGDEDGRFNNPSAIAIDSKDNIYVADTGNHRIQKLDSHGNFLWSWNMKEDGFEQPVGLAIDAVDNIYVVDKKENSIQKFALYGVANKNVLPSWIKNTAIWWAEGVLDKKDFSQSVRYVANQGIIKTPSMSQSDIVKTPNWLKGNVKQWYSGQIDDNTFWASIQYLLSIGAMKI